MKLIKDKFHYPDLQRVENELGRFYIDSRGQEVPSVTNVLSSTSDQSGIEEWKRRVGNEEAERILQESSSIGSNVHDALENYLQDKEWEIIDDGSYISKTSILILESFINNLVNDINEVWGLESGLILDGLYAGTADCIAVYKNKPAIIDFKTAKKLKRKDWIESYFLQGAAYANAHNVMFETNIEEIVILMVDRDLLFKEFHIKRDEFAYYTKSWKTKLLEFFNHHREA